MEDITLSKGSRFTRDGFHFIQDANLDGVKSHAVFRLPRKYLRQCGITLQEFRRTDTKMGAAARNYEMCLHLFLQMANTAYKNAKDSKGEKMFTVWPFLKMYMEWIPSVDEPDVAMEYRFHIFVFDDAIKLGEALMDIIKEANKLHELHLERSSNSRAPDPMNGIKSHQSYKRVHEQLYYSMICPLARGDHRVSNNLDQAINEGISIDDPGHLANPVNVFSLKHCIRNSIRDFPTKIPSVYQLTKQYEDGPERYKFPDYGKLIRLTPFQMHPAELIKKYLPEYQMMLEKRYPVPAPIAPPEAVDDEDDIVMPEAMSSINTLLPDVPQDMNDGFRQDTHNQFDTRNSEDLEKERLSRYAPSSDIEIMTRRAREAYKKDVLPFLDTEEYAFKRREYQEFMIKDMESRCLTSDAEISDPGKAILSWLGKFESSTEKPYQIKCKIEDLSVFATSVCRTFLYFENLFMVSTQHAALYMTLMARLDAYRYDHSLHANLIFTGEGATCKSFVLDETTKCSVPGTVDQLTRQTMMSESIDGDRDDQIVVFDEFPPGMGVSSNNKKNMDNTQATMYKTRLTTNEINTKTYWYNEVTGMRSCRIARSSCIGVFLIATNDPREGIDSALATRFYWGNFEKMKRPGRDIDDCVNALRNMTENDKINVRRARNYFRLQQARVWLVENLIRVGVLEEVNMTVANILLQKFKQGIEKRGIQVSTARAWTRVKIMCRIQTICAALDIVFNCEDSLYANTPFHITQLLEIEPYLVCTEEILAFTLTMLSNEFYSPIEQKVLSVLYKIRKNSVNKFGNAEREISNDYIKLEPMKRLTTIIQSSLSVEMGKTSQHNISALFIELSRKQFRTKSYKSIAPEVPGFPDKNENTMNAINPI